jgi:hypothetical protein
MFKSSIITIDQFIETLKELPEIYYSKPCTALSNASIGKHTRHIIELYQSLLNGYNFGEVCYDNRKRDKKIEQEKSFAIEQLNKIQELLHKPNKQLNISYQLEENNIKLESNYYREVMYNLEHLIHHEALIRVAIEQDTNISLSESFGVAFSSIQHKKNV